MHTDIVSQALPPPCRRPSALLDYLTSASTQSIDFVTAFFHRRI
jgi:hypothetical protein